MSKEVLQTVTRLASEILDVPTDDIDIDLPLDDLGIEHDEYQDLFERAAKAHNVPITDIINSMPIYSIKRRESIMTGLQDLAPFCPSIAERLKSYTTHYQLDSLRSIAQSIEAKSYVSSGQSPEPMHGPNSKTGVFTKYGVLVGLSLGLPALNAWGPCNPLCGDCSATVYVKFFEFAQWTLPIFAVILLALLGPALWDIYDTDRHRRTRKSRLRRKS